jgi:hypothetical protein
VVFTSAGLGWWASDLDDAEHVVFNRGTLAEWRVTGAEVTPWLAVNVDRVRPIEDQSERLVTR